MTLVAEQLRRRVPGGIGTYIRGLVRGLAEVPGAPDVCLLLGGRPGVSLAGAALDVPVRAPALAGLPTRLVSRAWERGIFSVSDDVVHACSLLVPRRGRGARVVTVHDLAWRWVPDAFPEHGRRWHEAALRRASMEAAMLVTPSPRAYSELRAAGVGADRLTLIEEGADHLPPPDEPGAADVLRRLDVHGPFLLTVSTLEPRKNLARLLAAYRAARAALPDPWPLVVVGPAGWGPALPPVEGVVLAGLVDDPVLAGLYAAARAMAYVPLVEGWGLPALEAMRAGLPVVASPMPSTGDAALLVDPTDVSAMAEGLVAASTDDRRRDELVAAGRAWAASHTWRRTAAVHVEMWRSVA